MGIGETRSAELRAACDARSPRRRVGPRPASMSAEAPAESRVDPSCNSSVSPEPSVGPHALRRLFKQRDALPRASPAGPDGCARAD